MKLSKEDKIEIYRKRKKGFTLPNLSQESNVNESLIKYLIRLIDTHGHEILNQTRKEYTTQFKEEAIQRVLWNQESYKQVAIELGLSSAAVLRYWVSKYKENGYNVIEKPKGRNSMAKEFKSKEIVETSELDQLKKENLHFKSGA